MGKRFYSRLPASRVIASVRGWIVFFVLFCQGPTCPAQDPTFPNIRYGTADGRELLLDLYLPNASDKPPLIIWVHGGAWRSGSKDSVPILSMLEQGFAIASVDYRLSPVAKFPAQIHDIKAAIRFLRGEAANYGFDNNRFIIAGASAGGHLAALVGVTNGVAAVEGKLGDHREISSDVQATVSLYGASNLESILSQSTAHGLSVRIPALRLLLGGDPDQFPELTRLASPVFHVDSSDPPIWLIHGDADPQMPYEQSLELQGAFEKATTKVSFETIHGGKHGGTEFYESQRLTKLANQLKSVLQRIGQ